MSPASSDRPLPQQAGKYYAFLVTVVAALGGFLFGYDLVVISGAMLFFKAEWSLSSAAFGFANSSAMLGCVAGPFLGAWMCDRLGRRGTLFVVGLLFVAGTVGTTFPKGVTTFNVFRIVGGLGVGLASLAAPMYIAEVAPARSRGRLGFMYQISIVLGCVASGAVAYWLARPAALKLLTEYWSWRLMFASEIVPVAGFVACLFFVPESPRWLVEKDRGEEALAILARINGAERAQSERDEITVSLAEETGGFAEVFQPGFRRALLVGICLGFFNNFTGMSGIGYYLPEIFKTAGNVASKCDAILLGLIVNTVQGVFTLLASGLVDRVGRRPLWVTASAAMFCSLTIAALVFYWHLTGAVLLVVVALIAIPHALGLGPLPWLMMSEIQPTRIRAKAVAISTTFLWIAGFLAPCLFPILADYSTRLIHSISLVFVLYAAVCVLSIFFGLRWLPETKGKTLEEITDFWKKAEK
jgi:SP family arabinose:H+ symporter-like MFS transporter